MLEEILQELAENDKRYDELYDIYLKSFRTAEYTALALTDSRPIHIRLELLDEIKRNRHTTEQWWFKEKKKLEKKRVGLIKRLRVLLKRIDKELAQFEKELKGVK